VEAAALRLHVERLRDDRHSTGSKNETSASSTGGGISWAPRNGTNVTSAPAATSSVFKRSASAYGKTGSCVPWLWKIGLPRSAVIFGTHTSCASSVPDKITSASSSCDVRSATSIESIDPCENPPRT